MSKKDISLNVLSHMARLGLTKKELCEKAGISRVTLDRVLACDNYNINILVKIGEVLGVDLL